MNATASPLPRRGTLLAINLLFVMVWAFAATGKFIEGMPAWFPDKFGKTFLGTFPGLTLTFWTLAASEAVALVLGLIALLRLEFLGGDRQFCWLTATLVWSLFVFLEPRLRPVADQGVRGSVPAVRLFQRHPAGARGHDPPGRSGTGAWAPHPPMRNCRPYRRCSVMARDAFAPLPARIAAATAAWSS